MKWIHLRISRWAPWIYESVQSIPRLAPSLPTRLRRESARHGADVLPQDTPVPASPALSRRPIPPCVATDDQGPLDPSDKACTRTRGPPVLRTDYDTRPHRNLHELRKQRGYARKDAKAPLCARLRKMDEADSARGLSGKRSRAQQDVVDSREPVVAGRQPNYRRRQADAYLNSVANKEILKQHA